MDRDYFEQLAAQEMNSRVEHYSREPGWIYFHGLRTAKLALWLADELKASVDRDLLYIAGLFHDVGKGTRRHNEVGARRVRVLLKDHCSPARLDQIAEMVHAHCLRGQHGHALPVRILQDADTLDHIGPIGPWLAYYWSGSNQESFTDHLRFYHSEENESTRQKMYALLNFEPARVEYIRRIRYEDAVFRSLHSVYSGGVFPTADDRPSDTGWTPTD